MSESRNEGGSVSAPLPEGVIWPTFEDGQPIRFGDEIEGVDGRVCEFRFSRDAVRIGTDSLWWWSSERDAPPKRPEPRVLDADGVPIRAGDTVYGMDGKAWTVRGFVWGSEHSVWASDGRKRRDLRPEWLTHRKPDTLESVIAEMLADLDGNDTVELDGYLDRLRRLMGGE